MFGYRDCGKCYYCTFFLLYLFNLMLMADISCQWIYLRNTRLQSQTFLQPRTFYSQNTGYYACVARKKNQSTHHRGVPVGIVRNCNWLWDNTSRLFGEENGSLHPSFGPMTPSVVWVDHVRLSLDRKSYTKYRMSCGRNITWNRTTKKIILSYKYESR